MRPAPASAPIGLNAVAAPVNPLLVLDGPVGVLVGLPPLPPPFPPLPPLPPVVVVPLVGGGGGVPVLLGQYVVVNVSVSVVESVVMVVVPVDVVVEEEVGDVGYEEVDEAVVDDEDAV